MGRMRRQRRYKACDPYSTTKKSQKEKEKYDRAPKKKCEVGFDADFAETKGFKKFQQSIERAKSKPKVNMRKEVRNESKESGKRKKQKKTEEKSEDNGLEQRPHETKNEYFDRLDQNIDRAINKSQIDSRPLRKKRKMHLQARDEKKKLKKQQANLQTDDAPLKDTFKFGETVSAPPTISTAPRKAPVNTNKLQNLKLASLLRSDEKKLPGSNEDKNEEEETTMEVERQRAIDAYRLMKKRKMARYNT